jgi:hypothetical protein
VTWTGALTTPPVLTGAPGEIPTALVTVPITVFGRLQAWTPQELAAHGAPFFDYQIAGEGTLTAFFLGTNSSVLQANVKFTGTATSIPEPATWFPMLMFAVACLWRRRQSFAEHQDRVIVMRK